MTPLKEKKPSNKKDDTASTHKNKDGDNADVPLEEGKEEPKPTRVRRTKE